MSAFQSVFDALQAAVDQWADHPFLNVLPETASLYAIEPGEISYAAMLDATQRRMQSFEKSGVGAGHRIGVLVENRPVFFEIWFALNALGASIVPINPDLRQAELEYLMDHSEMIAAIVLPQRQAEIVAAVKVIGKSLSVITLDQSLPPLAEHRAPCLARAVDDECALLYTSGTTGKPKGCILSNRYYLNNGLWYNEAGGLMPIRPGQERMLTPLPLFHMNAMATSTMAMMMSGGCLTVLDRFHPKTWWDSVRAARATIVHYLGVMPPMLMSAPPVAQDKDHHVIFGFGAGVHKTLHGPFEERFGFPLIEAWAMTETGGAVIIAANREPRHLGISCIGRADAQTDLRIIREDGSECDVNEAGELLVRRRGGAPRQGFFKAYLKDPDATEEAWQGGYFHTGDVVRRDHEGYIYFVDRRKNVIRRSGENIAAVEVESALQQHPAVAAAAVAAVPDLVRGDEVFACIILRDPPTRLEDKKQLAEQIVQHALGALAYYKAPGYIAFVSSLPVTATQKVQRSTLKDLVASLVDHPETFDLRAMKKRTA